jgi:Flp pilus assembly protein TadG
MLPPIIRRPRGHAEPRSRERGVTMALVAIAMFSIVAMAGLAIDVGTLYQANAEAQRSADAAALAAARALSLTGITGDPANSSGDWATACAAATTVAQAVGQQDTVGGAAPTVTATFAAGDGKSDCTYGGGGTTAVSFGTNPSVTVKVTQASLPTYFARIWGRLGSSVSATATAEAFNPSQTAALYGTTVPVQPRCVKPLIVPNKDPGNPAGCTAGCSSFVNTGSPEGAIVNGGIRAGGVGSGVVGETFNLAPNCPPAGACLPPPTTPAVAPAGTLQYVPGAVPASSVSVPSCGNANPYQQAVAGCDQTTQYQCGVLYSASSNPNEVDISDNPAIATSDVTTAAQCLTNSTGGADSLNTGSYPYQITAGGGNPLGVAGQITSSNSIVTIPIYDSIPALIYTGTTAPVTIVGFLQVFINSVTGNGNLNVTVLNIAGCGNAVPSAAQPIYGTSPVPVRLITPP